MRSRQANRPSSRRARGAVMIETVLILPFIMVVLVLTVYLGWNFRRLSQMTNMDRFVAWHWVTRDTPRVNLSEDELERRNTRLNDTFFGLNNDQADELQAVSRTRRYTPQGHADLRDRQSDELFSYLDALIENSPGGLQDRFRARHNHFSDKLTMMAMSDRTRNAEGHSRLDGDWRYVNGVFYREAKDRWDATGYRVTPASSLREVFYAEYDEAMTNMDNALANRIRGFYSDYPCYKGPDIDDESCLGSGGTARF